MEAFIRFIEAAARKWFPYMADSSLQLGLLFAFIWIATKIFRNQSARFLYLVWLVFFVKAILPPSIRIPGFFSTPDIFPMQKFPTVALPIVQTVAEPQISLSYMGFAFLVWFFGMAGLFILFVVKNFRFHRRIIASHREIQLSTQIPIPKNIRIFVSPEISSPFVMGLFSSRIYVPEHALTWPENEIRAVIYHELAHIQRRDIFVILLQNLIQLAYFFHPFVWIANIQAARFREKACDDFAIQTMQGSSSDYSKFLLNSLDRVVKWQAIPSLTNFFHPSRKILFQRFEYILTRKEHAMNKLTWLHKLVLAGMLMFAVVISCDKKESMDQSVNPNVVLEKTSSDIPEGFVPYDKEPSPIGGFNAIRENLHYPELARRAGIEGTVILYVQIDEQGDVVNTRVIKSLGDNGCDEAAVEAIKKVKWIPAEADGKPVKVWISVPVRFKLSNGDENQTDETKIKETFVPFDEEPTPVGGFTAVHKNLQYPEIARKAGIEGAVLVYARINENGDVTDTKVLKSLGDNGCDEAAVEAIKKTKWNPAKQKGKPVAVWVTVPVRFKLSQK